MKLSVVDVEVEDGLRSLRATLDRLERIYEMTSEEMLAAVNGGQRNDTAEIAIWMIQYRHYQELECNHGRS